MNTSEVLNRAADLIEERGWCQGNWPLSERAPVCLEGAMLGALHLDAESSERLRLYASPSHDAVADYLGRDPQPRCAPIMDALYQWNDADDRTAAEVIETLRACAVIEAARESEREPVSV